MLATPPRSIGETAANPHVEPGCNKERQAFSALSREIRYRRARMLDRFEPDDIVVTAHLVADVSDPHPRIGMDKAATRFDPVIAEPNLIRSVIKLLPCYRPSLQAGVRLTRRCQTGAKLVEASLHAGEPALLDPHFYGVSVPYVVPCHPPGSKRTTQNKGQIEQGGPLAEPKRQI